MANKVNTYLVAVTIIEGRHFIWDNMNSAVIVRVANKKKCTSVQKFTDCPFYNEYFVFELHSTYEKLLEKAITITVIQPRTFCRKRKILGSVKLDVATVMNQKNCQFYHRWAVLASPKADVASGPTGYVKLDITILARGQTPKLPLHIANDEIEGNLLTPMTFVGERQRAKFTFNIYRCEHLHAKILQFIDPIPGKHSAAIDIKPSSHVTVSFAGSVANTTKRKGTADPVFNEKLTITDLFPPLCQRVKLEICFNGIKKSVQAVHFLNLKHISNDTVEGFLPTFGPAYIYLYSKQILEGYAGTILMSMRTEFLDDTIASSAAHKTSIQHGIAALNEENLFSFEQVFLFAAIFEANCISKKYSDKLVSFRITLGSICSELNLRGGLGDEVPANVTIGQKPMKTGKNFYYLNFAEEKPCLSLRSKWPDFRKRMYHSNMLEKIAKTLKTRLEEIELMFTKTSSALIEDRLKETIDILFTMAKKYVEVITVSYDFDYGSPLDKERTQMCLRSMNGILDRLQFLQANKSKKLIFRHLDDIQKKLEALVEDNGILDRLQFLQANKSKKLIFRHLDDIQKKLEALVEDAQPCWPDVFLWMTCGNKKVGCLRIPAREIVFSPVEEEIGHFCGKITPRLFMLEDKNAIICKIELLMWAGLEKQQQDCFNLLPKGFKYEGRQLVAEEKHLFEGKAYIFEGEIQPGFDESGLVDPFVQVCLNKELKETQVKKNVLVPVWDQTLTFHNVCLYGAREHIIQNPPSILVQMFDQDPLSVEFVGRTIVRPNMRLLDGTSELKTTQDTKLAYHYLRSREEVLGEVLAAFELIEISQPTQAAFEDQLVAIPSYLKPRIESYRVEVLFWGVRNLKKVNLIRINRPKITFYCGNKTLESQVMENARKYSNFIKNTGVLDVNMASQDEYPEAFQFKLFDSRKFGVYVFAGISISDTAPFLFKPMTVEERLNLLSQYKSSSLAMHSVTSSEVFVDNWDLALRNLNEDKPVEESAATRCCKALRKCLKCFGGRRQPFKESKSDYSLLSSEDLEEDYSDFDWWTKFYASIDEHAKGGKKEQIPPAHRNMLKVYANELENQPEFQGFSDMLTSFEIFKGKRTGDELLDEQLTTAVFKGSVKIYQWPPEDGDVDKYVTPNGTLVKNGIFCNYPPNAPVQYILRIYCVRAINLRPKDLNGKSDPYIQIQLGAKLVSDRENYIPKDVNPIFGRCFEFQASFPETTSVTVKVSDYDTTSADDLIGETKIDLENRFYTKHGARCGLAESYFDSGYCRWRDQKKPTEILAILCKKWGIEEPIYSDKCVTVNGKEFAPVEVKSVEDPCLDKENLALEALRNWHEMSVVGFKLVPEHVETRSLFTPDKPGIEQGKIQLWIDMFPRLDCPVPDKINITPRKPVSYELRVIIWNTEDIILSEDDFFSGEKKSDIYVKGWLDQPQNTQFTDVHYRSLTGEGNFNWRFIFKFDYMATENKLVMKRMESIFSKDATELKIPCALHLTVWDNDTFSADDFLGSLVLELARMPRGARSSKKCDLSIMEPNAKKSNLFKLRRTKGWWPFQATDRKTQQTMLGGKVELELEILTKEEAQVNIVGMGRQGPEALPPPKRPDTSFTWFRNPLKSCKYVVCKTWRCKILKCCFCIFLVCFVVLAIYTLPGEFVRKTLNSLI
uniref:C2 domain-containing protein n=1 Tax=Dendroctonus ponderosae TaxID=77166 RepID=A0AAR5QBP0_DENPD